MGLRESDKKYAYARISKSIDAEEILESYPNLPPENVDLFFATSMHNVTEEIRKSLIEAAYGFVDARDVGVSSLRILKDEILDKTKYFHRNQKEFNQNVKDKKEQYGYEQNYDNPFYVSNIVFNRQFENLEKDTEQDIYAKTLYWSNKAVRDVNVVREKIVNDISESPKAIEWMGNYENECKLNLVGEDNKNNLRDDYIDTYKRFLLGEITKEELEQTETYTKMESILSKYQEQELQISPEEAYTYLCLSTSRRNLYLLKDSYIEECMSAYAKLQQSERENDELAIFQTIDCKMKGKLKSRTNGTLLTILVKGTNAPINVHVSSAHFKDMEENYNVEVPQGVVKLDYRNLIYVKYSDEQKDEIERLNNREDKNFMDFEVRDFIESQYNLCNDLDKVKVLEEQIQR